MSYDPSTDTFSEEDTVPEHVNTAAGSETETFTETEAE